MFTRSRFWYVQGVESKEERRKREARERTRRWLERHPEYKERARELNRLRLERNRDSIRAKEREQQRRRYAIDPEPTRARNREWYSRNKEQRHEYYLRRKAAESDDTRRARERQKSRRRYQKNPKKHGEYQKEWRKRNPEKAHAYLSRCLIQRSRAIGLQSFTTAEWFALVNLYEGRCAYCGVEGPLEMDHRVPLCRGGANTIDNILPACRHCNRRKHRKTEDEFRALLEQERAQGTDVRVGREGNAGTTSS